jgi:predicted secreted protein
MPTRFPRRRHLAIAGAVLLLALTGCGSGGTAHPGGPSGGRPSRSATPPPHPALGTVHTERPGPARQRDRSEEFTVGRGERFSIAMPQNVSARADWQPAAPSGTAVRAVGSTTGQSAQQRQMDGAGSTEYFVFQAVRPGETRIVFRNRFATDRGSGGYSPDLPRTVTYRVTVR